MSIRVKGFASTAAQLGIHADGVEIAYRGGMTIACVWAELSSQSPPENLLCARNHEYASFADEVADGDEIAFFPPVTGG